MAEIALEPLDAPIGQNDTMDGEPPGIHSRSELARGGGHLDFLLTFLLPLFHFKLAQTGGFSARTKK